MKPTLEACPCCGGPGKLKDSQGRQVRQGWVGCPACGLYISWKISPDGAVRKWNRRAWSKELTPEGRDLVTMLPGAVNSLAAALLAKLAERILCGDPAEPGRAADATEVAKPRWIPVTERLPFAESGNASEKVLVTDGQDMAISEWLNFEMCEPYWSYTGIGDISHWMPLPEPPKEA